ncbi:pilus assembly protein [Phenylobacterium sp.]|uniref:TadE/TadG family type IV pilus assembly protein n=1 Tax=Phenylobacterium sp. TaxID=1871053 RepID=UPI00286A322E|nr:pilus assembly protein [Phenylobacterium sp.]
MLNRLLRAREGSAAVEFAFIAPVMLLFYFGLVEVSQALLANRRASHVATAVGDIVGQNGNTTIAEVDQIFDIAGVIFRPLPTATLSTRVTSVRIEANGAATVLWSQSHGSLTALSGTLNDVPATFVVPGRGLIRADTTYTYTSPLQELLPNPITLSHTTYMSPRNYVAVTRPN